MKKKFCRDVLSLAFTALLSLQMPAQLKALKIGDAVPEEVWTMPLELVNSPKKTTDLSKDRDKLILLDFWATWCAACLKNFPKMDSVEKEFDGKIKIVPVTKENHEVLAKFFASKNGQRYKHLESVAADRLFSELFPHTAIPFIVWIKDGKVINTTDAEQVTAQNITELLKGESSSLQTVIQISRDRPLMLAEQFDLEKGTALMNYVLFSKGRIRAIPPGSGFHRQGTTIYGRQLTNVPLLGIYRSIAYELFEAQGQQFSRKRLVNLVKNPVHLDFVRTDDATAIDAKSYSIEFIVPVAQAGTLYPEMLKAVNNYSGYMGALEVQRTRCLVLKRNHVTEKKQQQKAGTVPAMRMRPVASLIADLNDTAISELPIVDESGYKGDVPLDAADIADVDSLKKALKNAGFELEETERELLTMVVRDK